MFDADENPKSKETCEMWVARCSVHIWFMFYRGKKFP